MSKSSSNLKLSSGDVSLLKQHKKMRSTDHGIVLPATLSVSSSSSLINNAGAAKKVMLDASANVDHLTSAAAASNAASMAPPSMIVKWPPVSSMKALPQLSGRVLDLSVAKDASDSSTKGGGAQQHQHDVIEFEVNQECELFTVSLLVLK